MGRRDEAWAPSSIDSSNLCSAGAGAEIACQSRNHCFLSAHPSWGNHGTRIEKTPAHDDSLANIFMMACETKILRRRIAALKADDTCWTLSGPRPHCSSFVYHGGCDRRVGQGLLLYPWIMGYPGSDDRDDRRHHGEARSKYGDGRSSSRQFGDFSLPDEPPRKPSREPHMRWVKGFCLAVQRWTAPTDEAWSGSNEV